MTTTEQTVPADVPADVPMPESFHRQTFGYTTTTLYAEAQMQQYGDAREAAGYAWGRAAKGGA